MLPPVIGAEVLIDRPDIILCDVRWYLDRTPGRDAYFSGHIPGAIYVDLDEHLATLPTISGGRHPMPAAASFALSMGSLGIKESDTVVAYDDTNGMSAGRLVWMLRILGCDAALLDGGIKRYPHQLETGNFRRLSVFRPIIEWPPEFLATADDAGAAGSNKVDVLVDSRASDRFFGENEPVDPKAGHIPGAVNAPFGDNTSDDGKFFLPAELYSRFAELGVSDQNSTVVYCGSGISACNNLLAIEYAGLGKARLYAGSWSQWSRDEQRPIATK
jgi:thiosulfate/3-mercaptopyruvate sulfurtransferase